ncbi:MAG: rod shape-determining protein RodA [Epsilonproteobacteria bacterium]|nr:MAG: rod shape-determining protein RodA [Campylobacterota bacterium]RLA66148.1 MAG: rod shape-determining protein RodA [Campylobacterota bacterium]
MITANFWAVIKKYDFSFFIITSAIFVVGILNLYSATHGSNSGVVSNLYQTQIFLFGFSLFIGFLISFLRPSTLARFSWPIYWVNIGLLLLVLFLGIQGMGAKRWILLGPFRLQPSEIMKISLILGLARFFTSKRYYSELNLKTLIIPSLFAFIPALLVIMQPDLGTGLVLLLIFFMVAFYVGLKWKTIMILGIIGLISGLGMYQFGLKGYQKKRITAFLNPGMEPKGLGYNAIQSKIAIGSGKFFGKGFKNSTQASLNYLPENHTDFVFSIFNEEHGFFGSLFLIGLYLVLFFRFLWLAQSVTDVYDSIVVIGVMSIFFWHTIVNMGMVTGLLPIVGLPLPLMSYGGSSLLTFGICVGLATSISNAKTLF